MGPANSPYANTNFNTLTTGQSSAGMSCNTGYALSGDSQVTCNANGVLSMFSCVAKSCIQTSVANSNYAGSNSIQGTTGQSRTVTCNPGYSGGGTASCQTNGQFTRPACTANQCTPISVAHSNYAGGNSIQGTTGQSRTVTCNQGYSGGGTASCQTNGQFTRPACTAKPCAQANFVRSNYKVNTARISNANFWAWSNSMGSGGCTVCPAHWWTSNHHSACHSVCNWYNSDSHHDNQLSGESGCNFLGCTTMCHCAWKYNAAQTQAMAVAVRGNTGDSVYVTCDNGYFGSAYSVCQPNGQFSNVECGPGPCATTQVSNSNWATPNSIFGTVGQTTVVTCDAGYTGGGTMTCMHNQQFNMVSCSPLSCEAVEVADSNYAEPGSIVGHTGQTVAVTCNTGFFGSGSVTCQTNQQFTKLECLGFSFVGIYKEDQIPARSYHLLDYD
jgi:hypothetical protein